MKKTQGLCVNVPHGGTVRVEERSARGRLRVGKVPRVGTVRVRDAPRGGRSAWRTVRVGKAPRGGMVRVGDAPRGGRSTWGRRREASLGSGASAGASLSPRRKVTVTDSAAVPRLSSAVLRTIAQQRLTCGEDVLDAGTGHALHGHLIRLSPKSPRRSHCCLCLTAEQRAA